MTGEMYVSSRVHVRVEEATPRLPKRRLFCGGFDSRTSGTRATGRDITGPALLGRDPRETPPRPVPTTSTRERGNSSRPVPHGPTSTGGVPGRRPLVWGTAPLTRHLTQMEKEEKGVPVSKTPVLRSGHEPV